MFIKIKLEPQNLKALSPLKKMSYFPIDDDATILNLKLKIEEYVNVPAERQEIRTLIKVFHNSWYVKEVCNVRGSAIMLYAYDECIDFGEPQFVCFLQVYTNEMAAQQQELEYSELSTPNRQITPTSSKSSVTLIACSDTDSGESDTETGSSKIIGSDSESGSSTDNSDTFCAKKRNKHEDKYSLKNKKLKVAEKSQYSETLCQYLEDFPKCSKEINSTEDTPTNKSQGSEKLRNEETIPDNLISLCNSRDIMELKEKQSKIPENACTQTLLETKLEVTIPSKIQLNVVTTTNNKPKNSNDHPCYFINPEIRDYLAIICSSDQKTISDVECEELLAWFFDRFRACDSLKNLQFDKNSAISIFEGKLWIASTNMDTFEWISTNIIQHSPKSYRILTLKDSRHLCEVVVPIVSSSKHVLHIFDLLEKQNKNITTLKWSLQSRQPLLIEDKDFSEKAVSTFCTNELFNIALDAESKENLEKLNFKLKYCFWEIAFKFI